MAILNSANNDVSCQVYLASDIQRALGIGRTKTYEFLDAVSRQQNPPFRVIRVGTSVRVPKKSFDAWLNGDSN